jgi:hypothetical protein
LVPAELKPFTVFERAFEPVELRPFTMLVGATVEPDEVSPFIEFVGTAVEPGVEDGITVWDEAGITTGAAVCVFWLAVVGVAGAVVFTACTGVATFFTGGFSTVVVVCAPAVKQNATATAPTAMEKV